jgi:hypothetical protein
MTIGAAAVFAAACASSSNEPAGQPPSPPAKVALGIRPGGDTEISPDMSRVRSEDLKKI